ncbi:hypothetical protein [Bradyrhizobium sp. S3.2.12]|uniref:hypothetical protein n=1 Tax=Bradyrhizobium sp. S3.2.12 TaxID=3156387 RepID=UPI003393A0DE
MNAKSPIGFQTEIDFELPKGYVDDAGTLHRRGVMRLATAADEILPLRDPRVQQNEAYLAVIVLARVIVRLGNLPEVHTGVIEGLYASDLAYLQRLYEQLNSDDEADSQRVTGTSAVPGNSLHRAASRGEA